MGAKTTVCAIVATLFLGIGAACSGKVYTIDHSSNNYNSSRTGEGMCYDRGSYLNSNKVIPYSYSYEIYRPCEPKEEVK